MEKNECLCCCFSFASRGYYAFFLLCRKAKKVVENGEKEKKPQ